MKASPLNALVALDSMMYRTSDAGVAIGGANPITRPIPDRDFQYRVVLGSGYPRLPNRWWNEMGWTSIDSKVRRCPFRNQIQHRSGCGGLGWSGHTTAQKETARADVLPLICLYTSCCCPCRWLPPTE